jgi:hypothetical protein
MLHRTKYWQLDYVEKLCCAPLYVVRSERSERRSLGTVSHDRRVPCRWFMVGRLSVGRDLVRDASARKLDFFGRYAMRSGTSVSPSQSWAHKLDPAGPADRTSREAGNMSSVRALGPLLVVRLMSTVRGLGPLPVVRPAFLGPSLVLGFS